MITPSMQTTPLRGHWVKHLFDGLTLFINEHRERLESFAWVLEALSLCPDVPEPRIVKTATKPMNALELVRRQLLRQQALKEAQKTNATTLCYRGNCYVKTTAS